MTTSLRYLEFAELYNIAHKRLNPLFAANPSAWDSRTSADRARYDELYEAMRVTARDYMDGKAALTDVKRTIYAWAKHCESILRRDERRAA